jgi:hypothetical protein
MTLLPYPRARALALALALAGCAAAHPPGPGQPAPEAERHRAALAILTVKNGTSRHLWIAFRPAVGPGNDVVLGVVGADSTTTVAPLPAGEPVLLAAIAEDSTRVVLPARSFDLGERWTWVIPADAPFVGPAGKAP